MIGISDEQEPGTKVVLATILGRRGRSTLAIIAFFGVALGLCFRSAPLLNVPGEPNSNEWVLGDFRDVVYYPVVSFVEGHNPYDEDAHVATYPVRLPLSPYTPLLFVVHLPFSLLSHNAAQLAYFGITVALTLVLAWCTLWMCMRPATVASVFGLGALILVSRPGYQNLLTGQTTLELVLAVYLALFLGARSPWVSALAFTIATQKPTFGIPLLIILLFERRYRVAVRGVSIAAVATIGATAVLVRSAGGIEAFGRSVLGCIGWRVDRLSSVGSVWNRLDGIAFFGEAFGVFLGATGQIAFFILVMFLTGLALKRVRRIAGGNSADLYCISVASLAILVALYQQSYSGLLLVLPLTALVLGCSIPSRFEVEPALRRVMVVLLSVPMVNFLTSWTVLRNVEQGGFAWRFLASINGAALLIAFGLYIIIPFRPPKPIGKAAI